jgi:hypothetical protein
VDAFTFVCAKRTDDEFVNDIAKRVRNNEGKYCPVYLYSDRGELLRRVPAASRKRIGKLTTKSGLTRMFQKFDLDSEVLKCESLSLETGKVLPKEAARAIVRHYNIGKK